MQPSRTPEPSSLQTRLELLLLFCDDEQLAAGGLSRGKAERLLDTKGNWSDSELVAVMNVIELDAPC